MLAGFSRISLAALMAAGLLHSAGFVGQASAESVERDFTPRSSVTTNGVKKLFNFGSGSSNVAPARQPEPEPEPQSLFNTQRAATASPSATQSDALDALSSRTQVYSANRSVAPILSSASERALERAIEDYEAIVRAGGWSPVRASRSLRKGAKGRAVVTVRRRLAIEGYLPRSAAKGNKYDNTLAQAVAGFQENHGLPVTGNVGKATAAAMSVPAKARLETMRANLIRLPEYTKDLKRRYVVVNIPAAKLEAVDGNRVVSSHTAIVGKPERPSPVVMSEISEINFNPYWHSPKSIVIKDIVPKVRKSRAILNRMKIKIFEGYKGPEVDPRDIDWHAPAEEIADKYHFRQDPGGGNAMASVKINFRNKFSVYMHDTPTKSLFNENQRYFSSGCVRVEDVQQLTSWVLGKQDGWNLRQIKSVARSEERIDVALRDKVSVRWVYLTAWAGPDGMVRFRDDIYDLDGTGFITGQPIGTPEESAG
jgi:murein L,D-transpeptidase YcbB/YkuD